MTPVSRKCCAVWRCKNPPAANDEALCSHHHARLLKTGVIDNLVTMSFSERLWSWIDKRSDAECWPWLMRSNVDGYGSIVGPSGKRMLAHRAAWEEVNGPIPAGGGYHGTVVMHICDNRVCCNPAHLRLGTQADNVKDMRTKKRNVDLPVRLGTDHPRAKITPEIVRAIRDRANSAKRLKELYGVNKGTIDNVRQGRCWVHVV